MTREELKTHCIKQIENCEMWAKFHGEEPYGKVYEEHKLILELLDQEPCGDCISRKNTLEAMIEQLGIKSEDYLLPAEATLYKVVKNMPHVTPWPKVGHWIAIENEEMEKVGYYCSECDLPMETEQRTNFCPNCGAKMQEVQE